jgi:hypothetical protein
MTRALAIITVALLATAACSKPTEMASNKNAKGTITVAAAPPKTPPPDLPPEALSDLAADNPDAVPVPAPEADTPAGPATVTDYRPGIAGELGGLPSVGDAAALAGVFIEWRSRAAAAPGGFEAGQIQLGADEQEYRPSDPELVAAEAGDRLSAALNGADEATKAAIAATVGDNLSYRRFDFRRVDVMGSGRYVYASPPRDARLPL